MHRKLPGSSIPPRDKLIPPNPRLGAIGTNDIGLYDVCNWIFFTKVLMKNNVGT